VGRGVIDLACFARAVIPHWTDKTAQSK